MVCRAGLHSGALAMFGHIQKNFRDAFVAGV